MIGLASRTVFSFFFGAVCVYGAAREALAGEYLDAAIAGALGAACLGASAVAARRLRRAARLAWGERRPPQGPAPRDFAPTDPPPPTV